MADETPPSPQLAVPQTVPRTPPVAICSLSLACDTNYTNLHEISCDLNQRLGPLVRISEIRVSSHHRGRRQSFSTNPRMDTEITVAKPERFRGCVKSPRVSGVKSNVLHDQSAHAQHPNHAPAQNHVWLAAASIVFHPSGLS